MTRLKIAIVGRAATGKSELAARLRGLGLSVMTSTTTRPPRYETHYAQTNNGAIIRAIPDGKGGFNYPEAKPGETVDLKPNLTTYEDGGHYFITADEAKQIPDAEKLLFTTNAGYEYFVTRDEIERADVCILNPHNLEQLAKLIPDTSIQLVHVVSVDDAALTKLAISRAADPDVAQALLAARQSAEDPLFQAFEDKLRAISVDPDARVQNAEPLFPNCVAIHPFDNDFTEACVDKMASYLLGYHNLFYNVKTIVEHAIDLGIVTSTKPGCVDTVYEATQDDPANGVQAGQPYVKDVPVELYVDLLAANHDMMFTLIRCWLSHAQNIGRPRELVDAELMTTDPDADGQFSLFDEPAETTETVTQPEK